MKHNVSLCTEASSWYYSPLGGFSNCYSYTYDEPLNGRWQGTAFKTTQYDIDTRTVYTQSVITTGGWNEFTLFFVVT
jgi:hypothetical protein